MRLLSSGIVACLCVLVLGSVALTAEQRPISAAPATSQTPPPQTAPSVECVTIDFGSGVRGQAALLRNKCNYTVYVGVCFWNVTPGSTTEAIACERGLFETWKIDALKAAMIEQTDGARYHWRACQAPYKPRLWWDVSLTGDARSQGACER